MTGATVLAPAKINFTLRVTGIRADGYHLLSSIVLPVSLFDTLRVRVRPAQDARVRVTCSDPLLPADERNLAARAAHLFLEQTAERLEIEIEIQKEIPAGAGLGGGSSDAAAVLRALPHLTGRHLSAGQLTALALGIGADVPFFLTGRPAHVSGIGEVVVPLSSYPDSPLLLAFPGQPLPTRDVYEELDAALTKQGVPSNKPNFSDSRAESSLAVNDLEPAATRLLPSLRGLRQMLSDLGAAQVAMTGSGSAMFGTWEDVAGVRVAMRQLQSRGVWARKVRVLAEPPAVTAD